MATDSQSDAVLQVDEHPSEDNDSALGSDSNSSLTQSLRSSLLQSVKENGRGYHRYKGTTSNLEYPAPEDEQEQDRLDLQHEIFLCSFDGKLCQSPLIKEDVRSVLDLGTGTGIWAIDFADEHPAAEVIGTDLSPIQPQYLPPNCKFEIDDYNSEWTFSQKFDFVHARGLVGTSKDYPAMINQAYSSLNPGGYLEMTDLYVPLPDFDGSLKGTFLDQWSKRQCEACVKVGVDASAPAKFKGWFEEAGFEDVRETIYKWPIGTWPKDKKAKYLGRLNQINFYSGMEGFTLRLWTSVLEIGYEETMATIAKIRDDIMNSKIHTYLPVYCVYGRRPKEAA